MTLEPDLTASSGDETPDRLNFDYIKCGHFRTIRPDGAVGALTPDGLPQIAFYYERQAIPQRIVYKRNSDGTVGEELDRVGRQAVVREMEVAVTFDVATAEGLASFLMDLVAQAKKRQSGGEPE